MYKISRLVKLSYRENPVEEFAAHIRDLYDLNQILSIEEYRSFLNSDDFFDAMYKTIVEDRLMKNTRTDLPIDKAVIFDNPESILSTSEINSAYYEGLAELIFHGADVPDLKEIKDTLNLIAARVVVFEEYRQMRERTGLNIAVGQKTEISKISVYPSSTGDVLFLRCAVNKEQQPAVKLNSQEAATYRNLINEGSQEKLDVFRLELAQRYFIADEPSVHRDKSRSL